MSILTAETSFALTADLTSDLVLDILTSADLDLSLDLDGEMAALDALLDDLATYGPSTCAAPTFDTAFVIDADGTSREDYDLIVPTVTSAALHGITAIEGGWTVLATGTSSLEAEEILEGRLGSQVAATPGTYALTEVLDITDLDTCLGWALLTR